MDADRGSKGLMLVVFENRGSARLCLSHTFESFDGKVKLGQIESRVNVG